MFIGIDKKKKEREIARKYYEFYSQKDIKESYINGKYAVGEVEEIICDKIKEKGFASISNTEMAEVISIKMGVSDSKCFMLIEGFEEHFILNLKGAKALKSIFDSELVDKYPNWKPYRKEMRDVVMGQLDVLISHWEK